MNPKKVKCPICGKNMIAKSWGMKRRVFQVFGGCSRVPGDIYNYVSYVCDCGNRMDYEGTEYCWENKCATKK